MKAVKTDNHDCNVIWEMDKRNEGALEHRGWNKSDQKKVLWKC